MIRMICAGLLLLAGLDLAEAKTCKCDQHKAEASAEEQSCSLSEDDSYCTITFTAPQPSTTPPPDLNAWAPIIKAETPLELTDPAVAFAYYGDVPRKSVGGDILTTIALTAIPPERAASVASEFGALFGAKSASLENLVAKFNTDGCVDARSGKLRILIITRSSERNRECKQ